MIMKIIRNLKIYICLKAVSVVGKQNQKQKTMIFWHGIAVSSKILSGNDYLWSQNHD